MLKLLEDRLYASDAMINGWILTGFPKTKHQMNYLLKDNNKIFKPSLTVIIEVEDDFVYKRSSYRRIDPTTGKLYYIDSKDFLPTPTLNRLQTKIEDTKEVLMSRLENWNAFHNMKELNDMPNIVRVNGENNSFEFMLESISDSMENSS